MNPMPIKNNQKVSIVIVNWNGRQLLEKCLASIKKNTKYSNYELVVVDNGSTDGSVEFLERNYPNIKVIKNNMNLGFARACNQAIKATKEDYIFLLNNDTEVMENWLSSSVTLAQSDPKIGIVGSKIFYMDMKPQYMGGRIIPHYGLISKFLVKIERKHDHIKETPFIHGAAFLVKRDVFNKIGLFDEGFFLYGEEGDLCCRARSASYKVMYNTCSIVKHYFRKTSGEADFGYFHRKKAITRFYLLNFSLIRLIFQLFLDIPVLLNAIIHRRTLLLLKAYVENIKCLKEIWQKRKKRKTYTFR